jgi:hypothetical protein
LDMCPSIILHLFALFDLSMAGSSINLSLWSQ